MDLKEYTAKVNSGEIQISSKLGDVTGKKKDSGLLGGIAENLGGLGDLVKSAPGGLLHMAGGLGQDLTGLYAGVSAIPKGIAEKVGLGGVADLAGNVAATATPFGSVAKLATDIQNRDQGGLSGLQDKMLTNDPNQSFIGNVVAKQEQYMPTITAAEQSVGRTGQRLGSTTAAIGTLGKYGDNAYYNAFKQGQLAPVAIEDAANLAMAGELAGTGVSALAGSATRAEQAAALSANPAAAAAVDSRLAAAPSAEAAAHGAAAVRMNVGPIEDRVLNPQVAAAAQATADLKVPAGGSGLPGDLSQLPAPPTAPVVDFAPTGALDARFGQAAAPYAPALRNVSDVVGSGTTAANKIASVPFVAPFKAAELGFTGLSKIPGVGEAVGRLGDRAAQGFGDFYAARADRSRLQSDVGAHDQPMINNVVSFYNDAKAAGVTEPELDAVMNARSGWNSPAATQFTDTVSAHADSLPEGAANPSPISAETNAVFKRWNDLKDSTAASLTPEDAQWLDRMNSTAAQYQDRVGSVMDERYQSGFGRQQKLSPDTTPTGQAQRSFLTANATGNAPIDSLIDRALNDNPEYRSARTVLDDPNVTPAAAEQANSTVSTLRAKASASPDVLPEGWAMFIKSTQQAVKDSESMAGHLDAAGLGSAAAEIRASAQQLPQSLQDALDQGVERPGHIYTNADSIPQDAKSGRTPKPLTTSKTEGEYRRKGLFSETTASGQLNTAVRRYRAQNANEAAGLMASQATERATPFLNDVTSQTSDRGEIAAHMADNGFKPVDPSTLRTVKPDAIVLNPAEGNPTYWVPRSLEKAIADEQYSHQSTTGIARTWDKATGAWKLSVLPLSPKWNVGNLFGNSIMTGMGIGPEAAGVSGKVREGMTNPTPTQARVLKSGSAYADLGRELGSEAPLGETGRVKGFLDKMAKPMYRANETVDNASHLTVYEAAKARGTDYRAGLAEDLRTGRITPEQYDTGMAMPSKGMKGNVTDEQAVQKALDYTGDFGNLSQHERMFRRVMPFYPWYRHITEAAFKLPMDNPYRVAWTLHLGDIYSSHKDAPSWLDGAVDFGGNYFLKAPFNPYPGGTPDESPILNPGKAFGAIHPFIQTVAGLEGLNLGRLRKTSTSNPNQGAGFIGVGPALGYLANQIPQTRLAADLLQPNVARNDDRSALTSRGQPIVGTTQNLGVGGLTSPDTSTPQGAYLAQGKIPPALLNFLTGVSVNKVDLNAEAKKQQRKDLKAKARS